MPHSAYAGILDAAHDCLVVTDLGGRVIVSNDRCPCPRTDCGVSLLDLSCGASLSEQVGPGMFDAGVSSGRLRVLASVPIHAGLDAVVEVTMVRPRMADVVVVTLRDVSETAEETERTLIIASEMRHRLSNAYAIAMAIIGSSKGNEAGVVETALRRLSALARVQSMARDAVAMDLSSLVSALHDGIDGENVSIGVPSFDVSLSVPQAQAILLVVGELTANSLKHGALRHAGHVEVTWVRTLEGMVMEWTEETPVPPVRVDRDGSNGFRLMTAMLRSVRGHLRDAWPASGLVVEAHLPL